MNGRPPEKFWKIRDKNTGWFVTKSRTYRPWSYRKDPAEAEKVRNHYMSKKGYNEYAECGTVGKTYSTLAGARRMMLELAYQIVGSRHLDSKTVFELTEPYFELIEYEVKEVRIIDS